MRERHDPYVSAMLRRRQKNQVSQAFHVNTTHTFELAVRWPCIKGIEWDFVHLFIHYCHSQKDRKLVFKTNYHFMQVKSFTEYSAILTTFIKLPFVIKIFVLAFFFWVAVLHRFYCIYFRVPLDALMFSQEVPETVLSLWLKIIILSLGKAWCKRFVTRYLVLQWL